MHFTDKINHLQQEMWSLTLALGEDICGEIMVPVRAPGWVEAQHLRVQVGQGADGQGKRVVRKRSSHIIHLEGGRRFTVEGENLISCFQTCWVGQKHIKLFN